MTPGAEVCCGYVNFFTTPASAAAWANAHPASPASYWGKPWPFASASSSSATCSQAHAERQSVRGGARRSGDDHRGAVAPDRVSARTLRTYEGIELIYTAVRSAGNYRLFGEEAL